MWSIGDPCKLLVVEGDEDPARGEGSDPPLLSLLSSDGMTHRGERVPGGAVDNAGKG